VTLLDRQPARNRPLKDRLLARIHRRYATVCQSVQAGPARFDFHRISDPDAVLNRVADLESQSLACSQPIHLPYWAQVWDSAAALSDCLIGDEKITEPIGPNESILDLGCGMGWCGAVAAALGAGRVVMADREIEALLFARLNALPFGDRAMVRRIDWSVDRLPERFDRILGADILYDRPQWDELHEFWLAHLKQDGQILLAEPHRSRADAFPEFAQSRGWMMDVETTKLASADRTIRVMRLGR
jgi:predicted nicotinamide N-methyase